MKPKRAFTGQDLHDLPIPTPKEIDDLVDELKGVLRGKGPHLQGAALADAVSMFFAGHHPVMREEQITLFVGVVRKLIPINEEVLLERSGMKSWPPLDS